MDGYTNKARSIVNNLNDGIITVDDIDFVLNECRNTVLEFHIFSMAFRFFSYSEEQINEKLDRNFKTEFRDYFKLRREILREIKMHAVESDWNFDRLNLLRIELINVYKEVIAIQMELSIFLKYENSLSTFESNKEIDYDSDKFINSIWKELRQLENKAVVRNIISKIVETLPWKIKSDEIFICIDRFFKEVYNNRPYLNSEKVLQDTYDSIIRNYAPIKTIKNQKFNSILSKTNKIRTALFNIEGKLNEEDNELFFSLIKNINLVETDIKDILGFFNNVCGAGILVNKRYELPEYLKQFFIENDLEKLDSNNFQSMEIKYEEIIKEMNITDILLTTLWKSDIELGKKQEPLKNLIFSVLLAQNEYIVEHLVKRSKEVELKDYEEVRDKVKNIIKEVIEDEPENFTCWRNNKIISQIYATISGDEIRKIFIDILKECKSIERANYESYITLEFENIINPNFNELKEMNYKVDE